MPLNQLPMHDHNLIRIDQLIFGVHKRAKPESRGASTGQAGPVTMGAATGLSGLDGMTQDGTPIPGNGDTSLPTQKQMLGVGKVVLGSVEEVAGGLTVGTGRASGLYGVLS